MLELVISGFQTGADIAVIRASKALGFKTGGTMPSGFRTLVGPKPEYADLYGAVEHASWSYVPRTYQNAKDGDGTIRFAFDFNSAGEKCTLKAIEQYGKPYFDIHIVDINKFSLPIEIHPKTAAKWLISKNIKTLNGAGNSEKTAPGIEKWVERYTTAMLTEYLKIMKGIA